MSFIDTRTLPKNQNIEVDICVIGSGAAGLAIAKKFLGSRFSVAILESGGEQLDKQTQDLYVGDSIGRSHSPLRACRLRYYGGSTNHWSAHVRTLDALDFEPRPWVRHSGWPIRSKDLVPYYDQARLFLGLPEDPFDPSDWVTAERQPWNFEENRLVSRVRRVIPESGRRLGPIMRSDLAKSGNIDVYLYANVLRIELVDSRKTVRQVEISTLDGKRHTARARAFVLATGGIENPRILLLSNIGTSPDARKNVVGRYFANHPEVRLMEVQLASIGRSSRFYKPTPHTLGVAAPFLAPSPRTQRTFKILNSWLQLGIRRGGQDSGDASRQIGTLASDMNALATSTESETGGPGDLLAVRGILEQAPNPDSRVLLGKKLDRFRQRQAVLDWRFNELDTQSARTTIEIVTREMGVSGLGRVRSSFPEEGMEAVDASGSFHHMGTTRMHLDPRRGVVDENCRVHGVSNLYLAGSSVFPTTGTSNPTYTILALSFRLAEHVESELRRNS